MKPASRLRVACVMDEFTQTCFAPECTLLEVTPDNWQRRIEEDEPDLLFLESAWFGRDGAWLGKISNLHLGPEVGTMVDFCRRRGIHTLLWNKEDPVHFSRFLPVARLVDYVFTTDYDSVERYRRELGHGRVHPLPFAAQPAIHNPVESFPRKNGACFAGSYRPGYADRQKMFEVIFDAVSALMPVDIFDRNFGSDDPASRFPEKFRPAIRGRLPAIEIDKAYKGYRFGINITTVTQSSSMCARRVFELMASNTPVISNYSRAMRRFFGDSALSSDSPETLIQRLTPLIEDERRYRTMRLAGLRNIVKHHTYRKRLEYMLDKMNISIAPQPTRTVWFVARATSRQQTMRVVESFQRQNLTDKKLLLATAEPISPPYTENPDITVCGDSDEVHRRLLDAAPTDCIGAISPFDYYGPDYGVDLSLAFEYSGSPVCGKAAHYLHKHGEAAVLLDDGRQYKITRSIPARRALALVGALSRADAAECANDPDTFCFSGENFLAADEFNYLANGADAPTASIASISDAEYLQAVSGEVLPETVFASAQPPEKPLKCFTSKWLWDLWRQEPPQDDRVKLHFDDKRQELILSSSLQQSKTLFHFSREIIPLDILGLTLDSAYKVLVHSCSLDLKASVSFFDAAKTKLGYQTDPIGEAVLLDLPQECCFISFVWRFEGAGQAVIRGMEVVPCPSPLLLPLEKDIYVVDFSGNTDADIEAALEQIARQNFPADKHAEVFLLHDRQSRKPYGEWQGVDYMQGTATQLAAIAAGTPELRIRFARPHPVLEQGLLGITRAVRVRNQSPQGNGMENFS